MRILLDTNFLISAVKFKVDIWQALRGYELFILDVVLEELEKLAKGRSKDAQFAKAALQIAATKDLKILHAKEKSTDIALLEHSKAYAIATQDIELKEKIKAAGGKVIFIRQRKYVMI